MARHREVRGVGKGVERSGHARTSITKDSYVHSTPEQQFKAANAFSESLFGTPDKKNSKRS